MASNRGVWSFSVQIMSEVQSIDYPKTREVRQEKKDQSRCHPERSSPPNICGPSDQHMVRGPHHRALPGMVPRARNYRPKSSNSAPDRRVHQKGATSSPVPFNVACGRLPAPVDPIRKAEFASKTLTPGRRRPEPTAMSIWVVGSGGPGGVRHGCPYADFNLIPFPRQG